MNLQHLTDKQLLDETSFWVSQEREALANVLWRLREIDERKLYSDLKCKSLYDYCVTVLKYSEGQASRRVAAARLLVLLPEIAEDIKTGDIGLTQLNQARSFFEDENIKDPKEKKEILDRIKGKTTRETEKVLWELKNEDTPRRVNLSLLEETVDELKRLRELKAHTCPNLDVLLKVMCTEVRATWEKPIVKRARAATSIDSRYVQVAVKAEVWNRDEGKCTNCGSRMALEIDHIEPFAVGGKTVVDNLQLLCRNCNQRKSILDYGRKWMRFRE